MEASHVPYDTEKFYYGLSPSISWPIPMRKWGSESQRGSSSYSLGQMVMIGCDSTTHAARSIKRSGVCSLNLFGAEAMGLFEYAGTVSGGHKLADARVPSSVHDGIPVLDDSQMSLVCRVLEATEDGTYTHFRCEITGRLVDSSLVDEHGRFRYEELHTVEYVGDGAQAYHRYFSGPGGAPSGTFVRSFKESLLPSGTGKRRGRGPTREPRPAPFAQAARSELTPPRCPRTSGWRDFRARGCARPRTRRGVPCRG